MLRALVVALLVVVGAACSRTDSVDGPTEAESEVGPAPSLSDVRFWAYQIQGLDRGDAIAELANSNYDLIVIEPTRTLAGNEGFDTASAVARIKASADSSSDGRKIVLAYIDIGEAEDYRTYWDDAWTAPSGGGRGNPDFLVATDPDGWSGDYPVVFWDDRWKDIVIYDDDSLISAAIADGFDGIYLDWVEAYDDVSVMDAAEEDGVDAATEMVAFIREMREFAEQRKPGFLIVAQNGSDLLDGHPGYLDLIDGLAQEDLSFLGEADTDWDDPSSGDIPQDEEYHDYLLGVLERYAAEGIPTFCVQYAREPENVERALEDADDVGCLPYVTLTPLDRLTDTPPPGY